MLHVCGLSVRRAIALAGAVWTTSATALADPTETGDGERRMQAQALFTEGLRNVDKDPKSALIAFRAAYDTSPDFHVLYNIGILCRRSADNACATEAFEHYLRDGASKVPTPRRRAVEAELKQLRAKAKEPPPAEAPAPAVPPPAPAPAPAPVPVPVPVPVPEAKATPPEPPPAAPAARSTPLVPWIVTGALAVGAGVAGTLTYRDRASYEALRSSYPVTKDELERAHSRTQLDLTVTSVLGGATLVSLGVALYTTFLRSSRPRPGAMPDEREKARRLEVAVGPTGIALRGRLP